MVSNELVERVCQAIAFAEGFGKPGALPTRCHNPGDLTDDGDIGFGTAKSAGFGSANITIYGSDDQGWDALRKKVRRMLEGRSGVYPVSFSIEQVGMKYSRDTYWGINVAQKLGVSADMTLADLVAADPQSQNLQWPNA